MRKVLYLVTLSLAATLVFAPAALAQQTPEALAQQNPCVETSVEDYIPEINGCVTTELLGGDDLSGRTVYDADTREPLGTLGELGLAASDLEADVSCADFDSSRTATLYYRKYATPQDQAVLDPDDDGVACTAEDEAYLPGDTGASESDNGSDSAQQYQYAEEDDGGDGDEPGQDDPCAGAAEELGASEIYFVFVPELNGCAVFAEGIPLAYSLIQANASVYDADTGEELGLLKDLVDLSTNPDYISEAFSGNPHPDYSTESYCGAFPILDETTAQDYYDGVENATGSVANAQEQAILDPDGDGLACTAEDEAFLAGDTGADNEPANQFEQSWTGQITHTEEDDSVTNVFGVVADIIPVSEMTEELVGEVVGQVSYDEPACNGVWVLEEVNEDSVQVEEQIEEPVGNCIELVPITLTPREDGSLEYYYFLDTYGSVGEGVLTRQGSSSVPGGGGDGIDGQQQPEDTEPNQDVPGNRETGGGDSGEWLGGGGGDGIDLVTERVSDTTTFIVYGIDDAVIYCGGTVADTASNLRRGRLPDTGGGWTVLLFAGAALVGGGWLLVRRFSR